MKFTALSAAALLATSAQAVPSGPSYGGSKAPTCRFVSDWSEKDVLKKTDKFISDVLYWEGKFHQDQVGYNAANGMSYDGTLLDWESGKATKPHTFSAASKEALQFMVYAHAIKGSSEAARFLSPDKPKDAPKIAAGILEKKLKTYTRFNETYPGFGGFIPWFDAGSQDIAPTHDWHNRVPGLDNGESLWAIYGVIEALERSRDPSFRKLAKGWQSYLDYTKTTVAKLFYRGGGKVCAVITLNETLPVDHPDQKYECETPTYLDDPYEGELFTFWLDLFGGLPKKDRDALWQYKRAKLVADEYNLGGVGPITVEQGYWFSSHEPWKVLELPYYDIDIMRRLYHNHERARTCNSVVTKVPGLFASVNNVTNITTGDVGGYISPAGIPSIASQKKQEHDVVTPYGAWPTIMFDKAVGLAWWRNMVAGKKMQNPYGSTEGTRVDGGLVSALVTWDSKITTVAAILGGVGDIVRPKMKRDGVYNEFHQIVQREYSRVFKNLKGENIKLCLPKTPVPDAGLEDFTACSK